MSSETAHFLIFGYDLNEFPGRGYLEAIGKGISVKSNEVAVLCHICCVEHSNNALFLTWGRPDIPQEEAHMLMNAIQSFESNKVKVHLIPSQGIDGFLILSGVVGEHITDSDPIYEGKAVMEIMPIIGKKMAPAARQTASTMNKYLVWCYLILSDHPINKKRASNNLSPVNCLVTQRSGKKRTLMPFREKWGLRGLSISSGAIYWGLCAGGSGSLSADSTGWVHRLSG